MLDGQRPLWCRGAATTLLLNACCLCTAAPAALMQAGTSPVQPSMALTPHPQPHCLLCGPHSRMPVTGAC
jgi:hypothetical protein